MRCWEADVELDETRDSNSQSDSPISRRKMFWKLLWWFCAILLSDAPIGSSEAMLESRRDRASEKVHVDCGKHINSTTNRTGTFTSPNYPEPYPKGVFCKFNFTGKPQERVQISFTDFDLHLPHDTPKNCEGVDAVLTFITINGKRESLINFCGNQAPKNLMSNDASMIVEFRSEHSSDYVTGFRALYKFVTDFGITGAKQHPDSKCEFTYRSEERSNGTFMSPNYPGLYPRDTECTYIFKGKDKERVQITFSDFEVNGVPPCLQDTSSDYVEFSDFKVPDRKIGRRCGTSKPPKMVESDSDYFRVVFKSDDKFDGKGFEAQYQFKKIEDPFTVKRISASTSLNESSTATPLQMNIAFFYILPAMFYVSLYTKL